MTLLYSSRAGATALPSCPPSPRLCRPPTGRSPGEGFARRRSLRASALKLLSFLLAMPAFAEVPSFRNQVQPILAKAGCSSGACPGSAAGQGGFKLSLRGYDDEGD